jgi:hypothetical protein
MGFGLAVTSSVAVQGDPGSRLSSWGRTGFPVWVQWTAVSGVNAHAAADVSDYRSPLLSVGDLVLTSQ